MNIALVCPYDIGRFGGVQNQVTLMAGELRRMGHDAWVVAPGADATQPIHTLGPARVWSVNDSSAPIKLSPMLVPRLRRAVAAAEVVHVHEPLMPLASLAARWTGKPLVGTFHADPSQRVRSLYRRFAPLRWHLSSFAALAAVSETARSAVLPFGDVQLIPNGVVTSNLPKRSPIPGRIAFVGRNDPRKGLDVAIDAIDRLRVDHAEAHLVVVTPDEVAPHEGVTVYRGLDDTAKAEVMASTEIYLAPNRRGESFGLTVAEAMASGAACVVSDIPAFAAVVGDSALLVEPGSADAMAAALSTLLTNRARLADLGARGRARSEDFAIAKTVASYLALYEAARR